jgi:molecular chaperone GrpE
MTSRKTEDRHPPVDQGDAVDSATDAPLDVSETAAEGPGGEDAAPRDGADIEPIEMQRDLEALRDRHLRLAAEYDNYRRRTERERTEAWNRAQAELAERLLDSLDDLQRMAQHSEQSPADALLEGVRLVERKLIRALESSGLEPLAPEGHSFDPEIHEAIAMVGTDAHEEDETVSDVFQKGYRFKGILLRPARVRVRKHEG